MHLQLLKNKENVYILKHLQEPVASFGASNSWEQKGKCIFKGCMSLHVWEYFGRFHPHWHRTNLTPTHSQAVSASFIIYSALQHQVKLKLDLFILKNEQTTYKWGVTYSQWNNSVQIGTWTLLGECVSLHHSFISFPSTHKELEPIPSCTEGKAGMHPDQLITGRIHTHQHLYSLQSKERA